MRGELRHCSHLEFQLHMRRRHPGALTDVLPVQREQLCCNMKFPSTPHNKSLALTLEAFDFHDLLHHG